MRNIFYLVIFLVPQMLMAQEWKQLGADDLFALAREKAFDKQRGEAREMLLHILSESPDYHEVRVFLGRTYAWDGDYENARRALQMVIGKSPRELDAYRALADVEIWSENNNAALMVVNTGLQHFPNDDELAFKKAKILLALEKISEASTTLQTLINRNPAYEGTVELMKAINTQGLKYTASLSYSVDLFNRTFDPAHFSSFQVSRMTKWGSIIPRINYANRFNDQGIQPEIDLYPKIAKGIYMYLNYGFASSDLFPAHRAGAEIYFSLPKSLEASAGVRYLYFDGDTKVTIYTGSVGWYFGNYWLSFRPFITPDDETGTSVSGSLVLRRYFSDAETYLSFSTGLGFSPDFRRIQTTSGLSEDQVFLLQSQRIGLSLQKALRKNFSFSGGVDFNRQELIFDEGKYVVITSISIGFRKKF